MLYRSDNRFVLVIEDPKKGDFGNVLALGELVADRLGAQVEVARLSLRHKYLLPLLKLAMPLARDDGIAASFRQALRKALFSGTYSADRRPLAVVSTLGRGEAQGAFIGRFWNTPAIHLGQPKRVSPRYFSAVITHAGDPAENGEIPLAIAPTRIHLKARRDAARIGKICLLLGGDAKGVAAYSDGFWERVIGAAAATARAHDAAVMISTSPRTGAKVEAIVEKAVTAAALPRCDLVLFGRGDRREIAPEIEAADAVFVTAESVSMISDAIASGARVLALHDGTLPGSARVRSFLKLHESAGRLRLVDLSTWTGGALAVDNVKPLDVCWSTTCWEGLSMRLGAKV